MQRLVIPGRFPGRNEATKADRTHWAVGGKLKKQATELVAWEAVRSHLVPLEGRGMVFVTFYEPNYKRDEDNVLAGIKYILDGLVQAKIIKNDTRKQVKLYLNPVEVDRENPRIEVVIMEESEEQQHGQANRI